MQIVIDIPEKIYNFLQEFDTGVRVDRAIANGIPIPDNATNGDVIKALFPNGNQIACEPIMKYEIDGYTYEFSYKWWNAPWHRKEV